MKFVKMQSAGNDYIYVDVNEVNKDLANLSKSLSRRRFSVGSDGIIAVGKKSDSVATMRIFNADGSEGATCGNGVRCAAYFAKKYLGLKGDKIIISTFSGDAPVDLSSPLSPTADMGKPREFFTSLFLTDKLKKVGLYVDYRDIYSVNVGNLHLVFYSQKDLNGLNCAVKSSNLFLDGVNIERVINVDDGTPLRPTLEIEILERGSGKTLSCGSGAVAVAYSYLMRKYGFLREDILVYIKSEGGTLTVNFSDGNAFLSGEVCEVYRGIIDEI